MRAPIYFARQKLTHVAVVHCLDDVSIEGTTQFLSVLDACTRALAKPHECPFNYPHSELNCDLCITE